MPMRPRSLILSVILLGVLAAVAIEAVYQFVPRSVEGQVVDAADGRPLPDAVVGILRSEGGLFVKSRFWTEPVPVDSAGRFALSTQRNWAITLRVTAPGHSGQNVQVWYDPIRVVPLARIDPDTAGIRHPILTVWTRDRAFAGNVNFLGANWDSTDCDLTFRGRYGVDSRLTIRAQGEGGIQQVADTAGWGERFHFALVCTAPLDGYTREVQLPMDSSPVVYVVRMRDGKHYAKFEIVPRSWKWWSPYRDGRTPEEHVSIRARANLGGGRGLCDCLADY